MRATALCIALALATASCVRAVPLDSSCSDQPVPSSEPRLFAVSGTVTGVSYGEAVAVSINDLSASSFGNGSFELRGIPDGTDWALAVAHPPSSTCTVEPANGRIAGGDVTDVEVRCTSNDARLDDLSVTTLDGRDVPLSPRFSPDIVDYEVGYSSLVPCYVRVAVRRRGAAVLVAGEPVESGDRSSTIVIVDDSPVYADVTAPDETTSRRYTVFSHFP